jgi:hypothetical protein
VFTQHRVLKRINLDKDLRFIIVFLGNVYSTIRDIYSNINSILPINRWLNRETKLDIRIVFITLYELYIEQLGGIIINNIVYIKYNTIRRTRNITI